ncbi:MAG: hypothetical protein V9G04_17705 [Nocardioides sp.]
MRWRTNAAVLAVLIAAAGCAQSDDEAVERAVTQAAQAYVDAIADGDLDTVEALTSDQAIGLPSDPDDGQDIRAELPDADAHIEDPWVRLIGPDYPSVEEPHTFQVSWTLDGLTGGDTLELALEEDTDPTRQESWRVTDALIHHAYFNVVSTVSDERIGSTELSESDETVQVLGYPGRYLAQGMGETRAVEPLPVLLGVEDLPPWDVTWPRLGGELDP